MTKFELRIAKEKIPNKEFNASITFCPQIEEKVKSIFTPILEISFLKGERECLPNGDIILWFDCNEEQENTIIEVFQSWMFDNPGLKQSEN